MKGVKQLWKTGSGDLPELIQKIHEIVQFVDNWKVRALCTVGVRQLWKTCSGDLLELVGKIHKIVQFVDNWKVRVLYTVGVSIASSVAKVASCACIAKA